MIFVEHNEDEGKPRAKKREGGGGDLGRKDAVFYAENRGAGYAEEKLMFGDILCRNWQIRQYELYLQPCFEGPQKSNSEQLNAMVLTHASSCVSGA